MLGATPGLKTGQNPTYTPIGLLRFHVYNILATYKVNCTNGTVILLLKIRNPWGSDDAYNGPWADSSSRWTDSTQTFAKQVGFVKDLNDGILFIEAYEFNQNFLFYGINFFNDTYYSSALPLTGTSSTQFYRFDFNNTLT